jgi:DNA mismatch endonuclease (patch repair protein)
MPRESRYETLVYSILQNLGYKFQKQLEIGRYRAVSGGRGHKYDVVFERWRLVMEVDGCWYHGCPYCFPNLRDWQIAARKRDREIDRITRKLGWTIKRIPIHSLQSDAAGTIIRALRKPVRSANSLSTS